MPYLLGAGTALTLGLAVPSVYFGVWSAAFPHVGHSRLKTALVTAVHAGEKSAKTSEQDERARRASGDNVGSDGETSFREIYAERSSVPQLEYIVPRSSQHPTALSLWRISGRVCETPPPLCLLMCVGLQAQSDRLTSVESQHPLCASFVHTCAWGSRLRATGSQASNPSALFVTTHRLPPLFTHVWVAHRSPLVHVWLFSLTLASLAQGCCSGSTSTWALPFPKTRQSLAMRGTPCSERCGCKFRATARGALREAHCD